MRLKSLEMHGFKSFPDRTKINFTSGVTVIVGPNGSGKSNVSDAIRWVLGELSSKNVRGNKMEDVIFGGTERRSPMGYAEVSLTIDNSGENRINVEYDEITITRRLYRSGDSEYLINNKISRLRDILDMFFNTGIGKTGYSIIGQGKISEIISQKSEERRIIFEEAAGISKYRIKKQEAERRLKDTDDNLIRLNDILSEIEGRVGPLEKESAKAKIYLELYEKKKAIEVALLLYDIAKINTDKEVIEKDYLVAKNELEIIEEALLTLDQRTERISELQLEKKLKYEELSNAYNECNEKRHDAKNKLTLSENELLHIGSSKTQSRDSLEREKQLRSLKAEELSKLEVSLAENETELLKLTDSFNSVELMLNSQRSTINESIQKLNSALNEKSTLLESYNELRVNISAEDATKNSSAERLSQLDSEISATKESISSLTKKKQESHDTLLNYNGKSRELEKLTEKLTSQLKELENSLYELQKGRTSCLSEIAAKEQRVLALRRMEEHFEGYSKSVKYVADCASSGKLSGICGPVSKLISVEEKYAVAIETALGASIQNIVVENEEFAKAAIYALKRDNAGRATFYPLTSVRPSELNIDKKKLEDFEGFLGIGDSLVGYTQKYTDIIKYLLGRTVVFDNLDNASKASKFFKYAFKAVTLDGQVINAGGSYTGGSSKHDSGILTRGALISSILGEQKELEKLSEKLLSDIAKLEKNISDTRTQLEGILSEQSLTTSLIKAQETSLSIIQKSIEDENIKLSAFATALENINSIDREKLLHLEKMSEKLSELEGQIAKSDLRCISLKASSEDAQAKLTQLINEKNDAYLACSLKGRDIENLTSRIADTKGQIDASSAEISRLEELISSLELSSDSLSENTNSLKLLIKQCEAELLELEEEKNTVNAEGIELEKDINELRTLSRQKTDQKIACSATYSSLSSKLERVTADKDKLTDKLFEEYELTFASALELELEEVTEENRGKKGSELAKYKSKIRELGSVNVSAIEEYKEVKERYEFLNEQIGDLNKSKNEFNDIISNLEGEMCTMFSTTFAKVNENFKEVFSQLFGGGSANLSLSDPENVLTSGIEIEVAPPGKIIKNLKLLSGGEQVFVAIAIFFAILKVNPSPFCLLDEIESALDEVNVDRFAAYAKLYSDNTQFIIITHRRGSMEVADTLYGITMQEKGISKVLSVNMNEIEQKTGVKL